MIPAATKGSAATNGLRGIDARELSAGRGARRNSSAETMSAMLAVRCSASAQTVPSVPPRASSRLRNRSSATPNAALTASQPSARAIAVRRMAEEHA